MFPLTGEGFFTVRASNSGGSVWAEETKNFVPNKIPWIRKLFINTALGIWEHSNGDYRFGE